MEKNHSEIDISLLMHDIKEINDEYERTNGEVKTIKKGMLDCIRGLASEKGPEAAVAAYEERILGLKDPELSFYFASEYKDYADVLAHEQVVIDSKNPMWSTRWVYAFPTCRLIDHIDIVGRSGDPECCYYMALFFRDKENAAVNIYFRQKVYASRSGKWNYMVTQTFRGLEDIEPHRQAVFNSGNEMYIEQLKFDDEMDVASEGATTFIKKYPETQPRKQ